MVCKPRVKRLFGFGWLLATLVTGCGGGPELVPVTGKVMYNGQPLPFGVVMFQPNAGQPAQGEIQPDGTFTLSSFKPDDGAVIGTHRVSVLCFQGHDPAVIAKRQPGDQSSLGSSLLPLDYARGATSGLTAEVTPDMEPLQFELKGKPLR